MFVRIHDDACVFKNLEKHSHAVGAALDDAELPVRVQAALALTHMVVVYESGTAYARAM